jgi:hypothetical protein
MALGLNQLSLDWGDPHLSIAVLKGHTISTLGTNEQRISPTGCLCAGNDRLKPAASVATVLGCDKRI